jgi:hypothetical protein
MSTPFCFRQGASVPRSILQGNQSSIDVTPSYCTVDKGLKPLIETLSLQVKL